MPIEAWALSDTPLDRFWHFNININDKNLPKVGELRIFKEFCPEAALFYVKDEPQLEEGSGQFEWHTKYHN